MEEVTVRVLLYKVLSHWDILSGNVLGVVVSTLGDGVTNADCITSTDVGSTIGSDG